jgi:hypothetical protein
MILRRGRDWYRFPSSLLLLSVCCMPMLGNKDIVIVTHAQPSLLGASLTSKMVLSSSSCSRSSFSIRASILVSALSTFNAAWGVFASSTKWLSQFGQYSSLSSNSSTFFRNAFLHFLHMKVISVALRSGWSSVSAWHSAQSNHFRPVTLLSLHAK